MLTSSQELYNYKEFLAFTPQYPPKDISGIWHHRVNTHRGGERRVCSSLFHTVIPPPHCLSLPYQVQHILCREALSCSLISSFPIALQTIELWIKAAENDQFQISPAASTEILQHTVWRTWLFIADSYERWLHYQFSLPPLYISLLKVGRILRFELRSERVNLIRSALHMWQDIRGV